MAIRPVSTVSFNAKNAVNQTNFEGRKNHSNNENYHSTTSNSLMKSIPLAALIAMSPLVETQAQVAKIYPKEEMVLLKPYKNVYDGGCNIMFISTDDDPSNAEAIILQHGKKYSYNQPINGVKTKLLKRENEKQYLDTLKIVSERVKYSDGTISEPQTKYVVAGPCIHDTYVDNTVTGKEIKHTTSKVPHEEYVIDKELYDYLLQFMNKDFVKRESRTVDAVEGFSELDLLMGM